MRLPGLVPWDGRGRGHMSRSDLAAGLRCLAIPPDGQIGFDRGETVGMSGPPGIMHKSLAQEGEQGLSEFPMRDHMDTAWDTTSDERRCKASRRAMDVQSTTAECSQSHRPRPAI